MNNYVNYFAKLINEEQERLEEVSDIDVDWSDEELDKDTNMKWKEFFKAFKNLGKEDKEYLMNCLMFNLDERYIDRIHASEVYFPEEHKAVEDLLKKYARYYHAHSADIDIKVAKELN